MFWRDICTFAKIIFSHCFFFKKWFYCTMKTRPPKHCFRQDSSWRVLMKSVAIDRGVSTCSAHSPTAQQFMEWQKTVERNPGVKDNSWALVFCKYFSSRTHQRENQPAQRREPSIWLLPEVKARRGLRSCVVCHCGEFASSSAFGAPELFLHQSWPSSGFHKWGSRGATSHGPWHQRPVSWSPQWPSGSGFHRGEVWGLSQEEQSS